MGLCLLRKKNEELSAAENLAPVVVGCVGAARSPAVAVELISWQGAEIRVKD